MKTITNHSCYHFFMVVDCFKKDSRKKLENAWGWFTVLNSRKQTCFGVVNHIQTKLKLNRNCTNWGNDRYQRNFKKSSRSKRLLTYVATSFWEPPQEWVSQNYNMFVLRGRGSVIVEEWSWFQYQHNMPLIVKGGLEPDETNSAKNSSCSSAEHDGGLNMSNSNTGITLKWFDDVAGVTLAVLQLPSKKGGTKLEQPLLSVSSFAKNVQ